jgi:hypothetical protein
LRFFRHILSTGGRQQSETDSQEPDVTHRKPISEPMATTKPTNAPIKGPL